jgi:hypothetical protein
LVDVCLIAYTDLLLPYLTSLLSINKMAVRATRTRAFIIVIFLRKFFGETVVVSPFHWNF